LLFSELQLRLATFM